MKLKKYASILGYNYNSSTWYEESHKIFNKDYSVSLKNETKDKKRYFDKIFTMIK